MCARMAYPIAGEIDLNQALNLPWWSSPDYAVAIGQYIQDWDYNLILYVAARLNGHVYLLYHLTTVQKHHRIFHQP